MRPWDELNESLKESNRLQADHIPEKLRKIGCGIAPVHGRKPAPFQFSPEELELLSIMEHDRFVSERRLNGWVYGELRDADRKTSPYLVPWGDLSEEIRDYDRQAVSGIPGVLANAGFEIYRIA